MVKKGYRALDVGRYRAYALIRQLSAHEPVDCLSEVFDVTRSSYYAHRHKRRTPDAERLRLRSRVNELFTRWRSAPGSRSIKAMMQEEGERIGRFKVCSPMRELALVSKQPGSHAYKKATVERPDIPNTLNRAVMSKRRAERFSRSYLWRSHGNSVFPQIIGQTDRKNHIGVVKDRHVVQANTLDYFRDLFLICVS